MQNINYEQYITLVKKSRKKDTTISHEKGNSSRGAWYGLEPFTVTVDRKDVSFSSQVLNKIINDEFQLIANHNKEGAKYLYENDDVLLDAYGSADITGLLGKPQSRNANMFIPLGCMNAVYRKPITNNTLDIVVVMRSHDVAVAGFSDMGLAAKIWDYIAEHFNITEGTITFIDVNPHFYENDGIARKA